VEEAMANAMKTEIVDRTRGPHGPTLQGATPITKVAELGIH
jgi:hypothetical protein